MKKASLLFTFIYVVSISCVQYTHQKENTTVLTLSLPVVLAIADHGIKEVALSQPDKESIKQWLTTNNLDMYGNPEGTGYLCAGPLYKPEPVFFTGKNYKLYQDRWAYIIAHLEAIQPSSSIATSSTSAGTHHHPLFGKYTETPVQPGEDIPK